jgi:NAD(P)-dependent dehydrogenase (short-subunit alcohol dehydrogenase family)
MSFYSVLHLVLENKKERKKEIVKMKEEAPGLHLPDAETIAQRLRQDQQACRERKVPSNLAIQLSSVTDDMFDEIAWQLTPNSEVSKALRSTRCNSIIKGIKSYLGQLEAMTTSEEHTSMDSMHVPTSHELETTLKVLDYLQTHKVVPPTDPLSEAILALRGQLSMDDRTRYTQHEQFQRSGAPSPSNLKKRCYICRYRFSPNDSHELYPALCRQCGMFNIGCSNLSLPEQLDLTGKIALVTGGRINLGYFTALRLLRCGAKVIVSSRYPADAAVRYSTEPDFAQWEKRLKVVGADFRTANDAFRLVHIVKQLLCAWDGETPSDTPQSLDILINNAAQTLTDPIKGEVKAISREDHLKDHPQAVALLAESENNRYTARVRGGQQATWIPRITDEAQPQIEDASNTQSTNQIATKGLRTPADNGDEEPSKSSWVQSLHEIPYSDLISAHSVNAFVPLILCRELLPVMGASRSSPSSSSLSTPAGYIINVSSREGILEDTPQSRSKAGHHVHTNMSKAAINMITETEAQAAWKGRRVAMNSVDPGYMSAAPECRTVEGCPIGFADGAARVLWPVAVGKVEGRVVWGRFLKHFRDGLAITQRG